MPGRELRLDSNDNVLSRKVIPYPFETRAEAVPQVESVIAKYSSFGHEPEQDYWWARAANGERMRFVIAAI